MVPAVRPGEVLPVACAVCGDIFGPDFVTCSRAAANYADADRQGAACPICGRRTSESGPHRAGSWLLDCPVAGDATIGEAIEHLLRTLPTDESVWASPDIPVRRGPHL